MSDAEVCTCIVAIGMDGVATHAVASEPAPGKSDQAPETVRVRREFPDSGVFSNVQYSFSVDASNMIEVLVLRVRDPKDLMQISIEDSASAVTSSKVLTIIAILPLFVKHCCGRTPT